MHHVPANVSSPHPIFTCSPSLSVKDISSLAFLEPILTFAFWFSYYCLHSFSIAAVRNHHKFGALKQHKFVLLHSGSKGLKSISQAKVRFWQGWFLQEALGENPFPCLFQHLETNSTPLVYDSSLTASTSCFHHQISHYSHWVSCLCLIGMLVITSCQSR